MGRTGYKVRLIWVYRAILHYFPSAGSNVNFQFLVKVNNTVLLHGYWLWDVLGKK